MAEKRRYTVSLPDHVADGIEQHAQKLGSAPTEYAGDVIRWWFGLGCPPVTRDEEQLRGVKNVNAWSLDPAASYFLNGDELVAGLMKQLGVPNLFAGIIAEHDKTHALVAFEDHPTHWVILHLWKGHPQARDNGLFFEALPKSTTPRAQVLDNLRQVAREMNAKNPVKFSQLPTTPAATPGALQPKHITPKEV